MANSVSSYVHYMKHVIYEKSVSENMLLDMAPIVSQSELWWHPMWLPVWKSYDAKVTS